MARHQTPNPLLAARGSKRTRPDEIAPAKGKVSPTYPLSPEGDRAWQRIYAMMKKLGTLSPTYAELMTITAGAIGDVEIASADLVARGHISITERGETKNPSFTIKTSAQGIANRGLAALGLTPTTIGKIPSGKKEEDNPFANL